MVRMRRMRRARGFSLLELMVVITIIGLLAGMVAWRLTGAVAEGSAVKAKADIKILGDAVKMYKMKKFRYPADLQELKQPLPPSFPEGLVESIPKDPWGNDYVYQKQDQGFLLKSLGADGNEGGEGENLDISNKDEQK